MAKRRVREDDDDEELSPEERYKELAMQLVKAKIAFDEIEGQFDLLKEEGYKSLPIGEQVTALGHGVTHKVAQKRKVDDLLIEYLKVSGYWDEVKTEVIDMDKLKVLAERKQSVEKRVKLKPVHMIEIKKLK